MTPLSICLENCNELIPDWRRRVLSSEARKFADGGAPARTRWRAGVSYFDEIIKQHERLFWVDVYRRRKARIKRMTA